MAILGCRRQATSGGGEIVDMCDLLGKRYLLKVENCGGNSKIGEYRVLEVSPTGSFMKLMDIFGFKFWKEVSSISFVEELHSLKKERKDELWNFCEGVRNLYFCERGKE